MFLDAESDNHSDKEMGRSLIRSIPSLIVSKITAGAKRNPQRPLSNVSRPQRIPFVLAELQGEDYCKILGTRQHPTTPTAYVYRILTSLSPAHSAVEHVVQGPHSPFFSLVTTLNSFVSFKPLENP
jgi:hypothetical protein